MSGQIGNFVAGAAEVRAPRTDGHGGKTRGFGDTGIVGRPAETALQVARREALEFRLPSRAYSDIPWLPVQRNRLSRAGQSISRPLSSLFLDFSRGLALTAAIRVGQSRHGGSRGAGL